MKKTLRRRLVSWAVVLSMLFSCVTGGATASADEKQSTGSSTAVSSAKATVTNSVAEDKAAAKSESSTAKTGETAAETAAISGNEVSGATVVTDSKPGSVKTAADGVPEGYTASGDAGTDSKYYWYETGSTGGSQTFEAGTLYIVGSGESATMTAIASAAWKDYPAVNIVVENIPTISNSAFQNCTTVKKLSLKGVKNLSALEFRGCMNLRELDLGEDLEKCSMNCFLGMDSLTHIKIPAKVSSLGYANMFMNCSNLRDVAIYYNGEDAFTMSSTSQWKPTKTNFYVQDLNGKAAEAIKANFSGGEDGSLKEGYTLNTIDKYEAKTTPELTIASFDKKQYYVGEDVSAPKVSTNTTGAEIEAAFYSLNAMQGLFTAVESITDVGTYYAFAKAEPTDKFFGVVSNIESCEMIVGYKSTVSDNVLTIEPVEGVEKAYIPMAYNAYPWSTLETETRAAITKVVVKKGILNIPYYAFGVGGFSSLATIEFEAGSTVQSIDDNAFYQCPIEKVTLPDSLETIGKNAFYGTGLTEITIPGNVKSIGQTAFYNCRSLKKVTLSEGVDSTIETSAFAANTNLTQVIFPKSLKSIGQTAFSSCTQLNNITLQEGLTSIGEQAFANCTALSSINIPSTVETIMRQTFDGCSSLEEVTIAEGVECIQHSAFQNTIIKSLTIPSSVTRGTTSQSEPYVELNNLPELEEVHMNGSCGIKVRTTTNVPKLKKVFFGKNVSEIPASAFNGMALETIEFEVEGSQLKSIGSNAFKGNAAEEITIPGSVETIGGNAFDGATNLKKLVVKASAEAPDTELSLGSTCLGSSTAIPEVVIERTGKLKVPSGMYGIGNYDTTAATLTFYVSDITDEEGTSITSRFIYSTGGAQVLMLFSQETAYQTASSIYSSGGSVIVKRIITGEQETEDGFKYTVDNDNDTVTITGYTGTATTVNIPDTLLEKPVVAIDDAAFTGATVQKVVLPATVTVIGSTAFSNCTALTEINLENVTEIGAYAFRNVPLKKLTIGNKLTTIGEYAFYNGYVGDIILPDSITSIGAYAFGARSVNRLTEPEKINKVTIKLPENEAYTKIEERTFSGIEAESVVIPANITEIGDKAFYVMNAASGVCLLDVKAENITTVEKESSTYVYVENKTSASYKAFSEAGYTMIDSVEAAKAELQGTIDAVEQKLSEAIKTDYREEKIARLEETIASAKVVLNNADATMGGYLYEVVVLNWIERDVYTSPNTNTSTKKNELAARVEQITTDYDPSEYTEETWNAVLEAMEEIDDYLKNTKKDDLRISDMEALLEKLNEAVNALKKKPSSPTPGTGDKPGTGTVKPGTGTPGTGTPGTQDPQKVTVKKVTLKKVTSPKKKTLKVTWKKVSGATGYQIQIGTNKKMTKNKKVINIKKAKTVTKTIKKLKSKKKYYVKVRAYKTVNGKKYYGAWSKPKKVKVK